MKQEKKRVKTVVLGAAVVQRQSSWTPNPIFLLVVQFVPCLAAEQPLSLWEKAKHVYRPYQRHAVREGR